MNHSHPSEWAKPELFIDMAHEQGVIDEKVFSLLIGAGDKKQAFTLGGYDLDRFAKSDLNWHGSFSGEYWSVRLDGFKYADNEVTITHDEVIVDSGTSYIIMPEVSFMEVYRLVKQTHHCHLSDVGMTIITCNCNPLDVYDFPDLTFTIDGVEYKIPRSSYVSMYGLRSCVVEVAYHVTWDYWILGLNFFE